MAESSAGVRSASAAQADLPALIRRHLGRALPREGPVPQHVLIRQEGEMWQKPGGRAMHFTATQRIAVDRVAFSWRARFPLLGPLALHVDGYADGEGRLEVRALGLPVQRQTAPEITRGEVLRYLAELPWAPHAMEHNAELDWRQLGERHVVIATHVGGERLSVEMEFDDGGDIVRSSSHMRPYQLGKEWLPTPWAGEFSEYKSLGGIRIPTRAEVYWDLPSGRFVYWRGRIFSAALLDERITG